MYKYKNPLSILKGGFVFKKEFKMKNEIAPQSSNILFYATREGKIKIETFFEDETFWLSQKRMAELFGVEVNTINYHLKEIFKSGELQELSTIRIFRIVQQEGKREVAREVEFYNLDVIIAIGYRVNSHQATQFRIWATQTLKELPEKLPPKLSIHRQMLPRYIWV